MKQGNEEHMWKSKLWLVAPSHVLTEHNGHHRFKEMLRVFKRHKRQAFIAQLVRAPV